MQTPTHLVTGLLIDQSVPYFKPGLIRSLVIGFLILYSHALLDALSALTYHPPDPSPRDRFWLGYHAGLTVLTMKVWAENQQQHKWAMTCAVLPDMDWAFIKTPKWFGLQSVVYPRPVLHESLSSTFYHLPLVRLLNRLPNLRQKKTAAVLEIALFMVLSYQKMYGRIR